MTTTAAPVHHGTVFDDHRRAGLINRKTIMWVFLGSECMFFGSLIATYMSLRGRSLNPPYPGNQFGFDIPFTSVSATVLLISSLAMVLAVAAIQRGDVRGARIWLLATAGLGVLFLGGQFYEFTTFFREEGLGIDTNVFGSSFYTLTGFHGAHVAVGVLWLLSLVILSFRGYLKRESALDVEVAGLYWHFVDIVWIVIFVFVYLLAPHGGGAH
ncbi:MAG: cytochrome b6 [Dehalococcoidia bacterium]|nr:MAG: cytochrome b6 [Dehalococcoidia bacterium]